MKNAHTALGTEKPGKLMLRYALPCVVSLLVGALYNIVDQVFIANAAYLGSNGNAANTAVFPLTVIALGVAVMIGDGACAFVSISMGEKKTENASRGVGNAVAVCLIASAALTAVYLLFADKLLKAFGANVNETTFAMAKEYFFWIALGVPFYMFGQAMNPVIRADGSPVFAMISTAAGAAVNLILDPVFILGLRWGMKGAAVATVAGQVVVAVMAAAYLVRAKLVKPRAADLKLNARLLARMLSLGVCSFLAQLSLVAAMMAINNMIRRYGALDPVFGQTRYAQIPMAVVGIVMKFFQIVISVVIGMAAGCIPIVGYNMGARANGRVKGILTRLLLAEAAVGAVSLFIAECFPGALIRLFGAANESGYYTAFAVKAFRIYLSMLVPACVNKAAFIFMQAMGRAGASTMLSMVREIVFGVGFALLLPRFFGLDGVLYSMPVSDILTAVITAAVLILTYRSLNASAPSRNKAAA